MPSEDSFTIKLEASSASGANMDYAALKDLTIAIKDLSAQIRKRPTSTENDVKRMANATRTTESIQQRINRVTGIDKSYQNINPKQIMYTKMFESISNKEQAQQRKAQQQQEIAQRRLQKQQEIEQRRKQREEEIIQKKEEMHQRKISRQRMKTIAAGSALGTYLADRYIQSSGQIGTTLASANPIANNYNYGDTLSNLMNLKQQQANTIGTGLLTGAGYLLGGGVGAAIGGGLSTITGSIGTAATNQRAAAASFIVNNQMQAEAFKATQSGGFKSDYDVTDARYALEMAIDKAARSYNQNYKEIDKLTKYAVAAQIPISMMPALTSQMAKATMINKSFSATPMLRTFQSYDVADPVAAAATANSLMASGFSEKDAAALASRIQNSFLGQAQGQAIGSFLGQNPISMDIENQIIKRATGKSAFESLQNGNSFFKNALSYEKLAAQGKLDRGGNKYKQLMLARTLSSAFNTPMEALAFGTAPIRDVKNINKNITPSVYQQQLFDTMSGNKERAAYTAKNSPTDTLKDLTDASNGAAGALHQFKENLSDVADFMKSLVGGMSPTTALSNLISPLTSQNVKSGKTGSQLGSRGSP